MHDRTHSFGYWLRRRRKALDLTQDALAARVSCSGFSIRKIEADERRPSRRLAERLATSLAIPDEERRDFLDAAREGATFLWERLRDTDGRLLRTWKDGEGKILGYLEDHAYVTEALLVLYESTFDERWFAAARETADAMIERFADPERGGFFTTPADGEELLVRRKDIDDHPIPSGSSSAAYALLRLAALTAEHSYAEHAHSVFALFGRVAERHPHAVAHLLRAIDFDRAQVREVALVGSELDDLAAVVRSRLRPHLVLAGGTAGTNEPPLMAERSEVDGRAAAYVCERFACRAPVTDPSELASALGDPG